jgi:hypothetical protein
MYYSTIWYHGTRVLEYQWYVAQVGGYNFDNLMITNLFVRLSYSRVHDNRAYIKTY